MTQTWAAARFWASSWGAKFPSPLTTGGITTWGSGFEALKAKLLSVNCPLCGASAWGGTLSFAGNASTAFSGAVLVSPWSHKNHMSLYLHLLFTQGLRRPETLSRKCPYQCVDFFHFLPRLVCIFICRFCERCLWGTILHALLRDLTFVILAGLFWCHTFLLSSGICCHSLLQYFFRSFYCFLLLFCHFLYSLSKQDCSQMLVGCASKTCFTYLFYGMSPMAENMPSWNKITNHLLED